MHCSDAYLFVPRTSRYTRAIIARKIHSNIRQWCNENCAPASLGSRPLQRPQLPQQWLSVQFAQSLSFCVETFVTRRFHLQPFLTSPRWIAGDGVGIDLRSASGASCRRFLVICNLAIEIRLC